jgi:hypothetical protein
MISNSQRFRFLPAAHALSAQVKLWWLKQPASNRFSRSPGASCVLAELNVHWSRSTHFSTHVRNAIRKFTTDLLSLFPSIYGNRKRVKQSHQEGQGLQRRMLKRTTVSFAGGQTCRSSHFVAWYTMQSYIMRCTNRWESMLTVFISDVRSKKLIMRKLSNM